MIYLIGISFFVLSAVIYVDIWSTCNSLGFNLSVIIFLISLPPSNSAKISFTSTLLISEKTFRFKVKKFNALYWPRDTESVLTLLTCYVKPCMLLEKVSLKNFSVTIRVLSKISYSFQTFNYFPWIFPGKTFFLFS